MGIRVVAVDIGSVGPSSKFAWAAFDAPGRDLIADGTDPETKVSALVPGLLAGAQAALLLEAPVPDGQPDAWRTLGKARKAEGNRPLVGGSRRRRAGDRTGAVGMDAPSAPRSRCPSLPRRHSLGPGSVAVRSCCWPRRSSPRLASPSRCQQAGLTLAEVVDSSGPLASTVRCAPQDPFNLLAAMALWAGLRIDPAELHAEVLVVAARPEPQAPRS